VSVRQIFILDPVSIEVTTNSFAKNLCSKFW